MSPEMIAFKKGYYSSDFFSLGLVIFQMLTGHPPFTASTKEELYEKLIYEEIEFFESGISPEAKDLIAQMTEKERTERIGYEDVDEIKSHSFFKGIDWEKVERKEYKVQIPMKEN